MPDAQVLGAAKAKKVKLDETAFGARFNGPLVHESVRAELNARRQGTAAHSAPCSAQAMFCGQPGLAFRSLARY